MIFIIINISSTTTINSGVYNINGINYQCLDNDNDSIVPEYLTICIYPTDINNINGFNYGKTNDEAGKSGMFSAPTMEGINLKSVS